MLGTTMDKQTSMGGEKEETEEKRRYGNPHAYLYSNEMWNRKEWGRWPYRTANYTKRRRKKKRKWSHTKYRWVALYSLTHPLNTNWLQLIQGNPGTSWISWCPTVWWKYWQSDWWLVCTRVGEVHLQLFCKSNADILQCAWIRHGRWDSQPTKWWIDYQQVGELE